MTTLNHRYPARLTTRLGRGSLRAITLPWRMVNSVFGSERDGVRITARWALLLASAAAVAGVYDWVINSYMFREPAAQMSAGKVLDHIYSPLEMLGLVGALAAAMMAVGAMLCGLLMLSDRPSSRYSGDAYITLWVVLAIALVATAAISPQRIGMPSEMQTAPLFFSPPKDVSFSNTDPTAIRLAAKLHLEVDSCASYDISRDQETYPMSVCRTASGITLSDE